MTLNDLKLRARALLRRNRVEQELEEELAFHVEREAGRLIDQGMTPAEARERAQARFGSTALAADRCRDERGTAFVDNTIRDVRYALRAFARAPLAAFTIVVTVAIGLGVVAVLFTVLNALIFRVDQVPDVDDMYAVERTQPATGDGSLLLSNNAHTGGTCFGDSGGPNFIGTSNVVGGVTSFGLNGTCGGTGGVYRVDRSDDLTWLATFGL